MPLQFLDPLSVGHRLGPGLWVRLENSSIGPWPDDDYFYVSISYTVGFVSNVICEADKTIHGVASQYVQLGTSQGHPQNVIFNVGAPDGATIGVAGAQYHANGTLVDNCVAPNCTWDATSGLWLLTGGGGPTAKLDQIIAAVIRTFPPA